MTSPRRQSQVAFSARCVGTPSRKGPPLGTPVSRRLPLEESTSSDRRNQTVKPSISVHRPVARRARRRTVGACGSDSRRAVDDAETTTAATHGADAENGAVPGDHRGYQRGRHDRAPDRPRSCRSRRLRPRCCSPSAPAIRSSPSTATRPIRPRHRSPTSARSSRTSRRSSATHPTSSSSPTTWVASSRRSATLDIPVLQLPAATTHRRHLRPDRAARCGDRATSPRPPAWSPTCRRGSTPIVASVDASGRHR